MYLYQNGMMGLEFLTKRLYTKLVQSNTHIERWDHCGDKAEQYLPGTGDMDR